MELATIDAQSHKVQTKLYKIPNLVKIDPTVNKIPPIENDKIYKETYGQLHSVFGHIFLC